MSNSRITSPNSYMLLGLLYNLDITLPMYSSTCSLYNFIENFISPITPSIICERAYPNPSFSRLLSIDIPPTFYY